MLLGVAAAAQTSREELLSHIELATGNYANYPLPTGHLTPAPKGYEPFYISHYGRHGSRYMTSDKHYRRLRTQLDSALTLGILTEYGKQVRLRLLVAEADAKGNAGLLTELGARQHSQEDVHQLSRAPESAAHGCCKRLHVKACDPQHGEFLR